jgi:hypothetical protein
MQGILVPAMMLPPHSANLVGRKNMELALASIKQMEKNESQR